MDRRGFLKVLAYVPVAIVTLASTLKSEAKELLVQAASSDPEVEMIPNPNCKELGTMIHEVEISPFPASPNDYTLNIYIKYF